MRAFYLLAFVLAGCSTGKVSDWYYKGPEHIKCEERTQIKICDKAGPYWVCECQWK